MFSSSYRRGYGELRHPSDLALGLLNYNPTRDADQQRLVERGKNALEHRDRRDVLAPLQLRDEGMRGAGSSGDLVLGQSSS
jgi:hypothetical protein